MSELLEQYEDYVREIRLSEAICNLPVAYHPNDVYRLSGDGRWYPAEFFRKYADVAGSQPAMDISRMKIEAAIDKKIAARKLNGTDLQMLKHFASMPAIQLPPPQVKSE